MVPSYGHPLVQAPNLSALAGSGTVFENAYCPFPLCAPSRAAMLTGRLASDIGVYDNAAELAATVPTLAHALRANGYHTAVAGKMHFVGPDQLHGFEHRLTADIYPADVDWTPDWSRPFDRPLPWYHTMESVLDPGVSAAAMQTDYDQEVGFQAARKLYDLARHRPDQPFLLFVSFTTPHDPWEIPERFWARYRRSEIPDPSVPSIPLERADPHSRRLRAMCRVDEAELTAEQIRRARHGYFAAVSYLDERVGEVLDALERSGLSERTTVPVLRRPRRDARRARALVQDVVPRAVGARAADRPRARRQAAADDAAGVAAGRDPDASSSSPAWRPSRSPRDRSPPRAPAICAPP